MLNFVAGDGVTLVLPILVDGEYQTPDANSVSYSVRDNAGAPISALTNVSLSPPGTEVIVTIAPIYNAKTLPTEKRSVILTYSVAGHAYRQIAHYRLIDWMNVVVGPDDVRAHIGLSSTELSDADCDLVSAYLLLKDSLGGTVLDTALAGGGINAQFANNAVIYKTIQSILPSLRLRALHSEQSGTTAYKRFSGIDFDAIQTEISSLLDQALASLTAIPSFFPAPFVITTPVDPVTGK